MKQIFTFLLLLMFLGWMGSCKKMPNGGVPFYLAMDYGQVTGGGAWAGDTSSFISDAWTQTTANNLGAYELPCNFPVLEENNVGFLVNAGVWESGQREVRVTYPFYAPDTFTIKNATPGQRYFHHPIFKYRGGVSFACNENFENGSSYDSMTSYADTNVRYGSRCGIITLTNTDSDIIARIKTPYQNNFSSSYGAETWMELDYKADVPFWVGIDGIFSAGQTTSQQVLFLLPSTTWKKEYIKLTNILTSIGALSYTPYFEAIDTVGGVGGRVYLDNIKVFHY